LSSLVAAFLAEHPVAGRARRQGHGGDLLVGVDQRQPVGIVLDDRNIFPKCTEAGGGSNMLGRSSSSDGPSR
jgi:hypothetical protein